MISVHGGQCWVQTVNHNVLMSCYHNLSELYDPRLFEIDTFVSLPHSCMISWNEFLFCSVNHKTGTGYFELAVGVQHRAEWVFSFGNTMPGQLRDQRTHKLGFLRRNVRRRLQLTQRLQRQAEAETSSSLPAKPSGKDSDIDNAECKFNVNSFKQVYVMNGDQCLYKCTALKRAHEVSGHSHSV